MAAWMILIEWLARLILVVLLVLSVWSVSIILERKKFFKKIEDLDANKEIFNWIKAGSRQQLKDWSQSHDGLRAGTVRAALDRPSAEQMEKAVLSYWSQERQGLEKGLSVLGTLGATTPFVGLLGTIMGIIVAFGALSSGQMDAQKIMFALAEALILTAVGLAVAIPAVIAYNYFTRRMLTLLRECESIKDLILSYFAERK